MTKSNLDNPEYSLVVSPEAKSDIIGILQYTLETWGRLQAEKYQRILHKELSSIQINPGIGHSRLDIPEHYRAHQAGQHFIIFRVKTETIYLVRILHCSMDFTGKF